MMFRFWKQKCAVYVEVSVGDEASVWNLLRFKSDIFVRPKLGNTLRRWNSSQRTSLVSRVRNVDKDPHPRLQLLDIYPEPYL